MVHRIFTFLVVVVSLLSILVGCSGGSGKAVSRNKGDMQVKVNWPELPQSENERFIPRATNSLKVTYDNGAGASGTQIIARPATGTNATVTFPGVPAGTVAITVTAYPTTDGTGVAQATASATAEITNGATTTVVIDLTSTIDHVTIDSCPATLTEGAASQLIATARDASNSIVLVLPQPDGFYWKSSNTSVATVDQDGLLTAVAPGTVTISAMECETGIIGSQSIMITEVGGNLEIIILNGEVAVSVLPDNVTLDISATQQFGAVVAGVPNQAVLWSVVEAGGGTITEDGLYTAPTTPGTYHVKAIAIADRTKSDTVTITVVNFNGITVTVSPSTVTLNPSATQQFSATVNGTSNQAVTWSVVEAGGGTVTSGGLYTAPTAVGTYHVKATSVANPAKYGTATVTVENPAPAQLIVFTSTRDDSNGEIYSCYPDGSNVTRLTFNSVADKQPVLSPDGTQIVYATRQYDSAKFKICIMDVNGSNKQQMSFNTSEDADPSFSPDGTKILYSVDNSIYRMDRNGNNKVPLIANAKSARYNHDGTKIVYVGTSSAIWMANSSGGSATQMTTPPAMNADDYPSFSPCGNYIIWARKDASCAASIRRINIDKSNETPLTTFSAVSLGVYHTPRYSPDGTKIIFNGAQVNGKEAVSIMNASGGTPSPLITSSAWDYSAYWGSF